MENAMRTFPRSARLALGVALACRFDGGDGQVALHGRGGASLLDPLGSARSHGCVRLANGAIDWIAGHVPVGAPVRIR
jgi:lipoprotein-anchoring transpeptidase ErfK/SrfK